MGPKSQLRRGEDRDLCQPGGQVTVLSEMGWLSRKNRNRDTKIKFCSCVYSFRDNISAKKTYTFSIKSEYRVKSHKIVNES
jgi:hypothetical protein